ASQLYHAVPLSYSSPLFTISRSVTPGREKAGLRAGDYDSPEKIKLQNEMGSGPEEYGAIPVHGKSTFLSTKLHSSSRISQPGES
ncbi:MAG TPA: hypothetical protein VHR86_08425, partial [Armatimonadota bacterium]|nr:hypothetical protein [Armatimonadota bacterium]